MAVEFVRDAAWWARLFGSAMEGDIQESLFEDDDPSKQILIFTIRFASGFRITALSSRPTNLRNKRGHIIVDEAAFHPDLRGLLKSALAVLIWGGRSRVDIISTHNGVNSHFYRLVEEIQAGKKPHSLHHVTLDDALAQGLYKRICRVNGLPWSPEAEAGVPRLKPSGAKRCSMSTVPTRTRSCCASLLARAVRILPDR
jgi:phage FluMu gp28-like protein